MLLPLPLLLMLLPLPLLLLLLLRCTALPELFFFGLLLPPRWALVVLGLLQPPLPLGLGVRGQLARGLGLRPLGLRLVGPVLHRRQHHPEWWGWRRLVALLRGLLRTGGFFRLSPPRSIRSSLRRLIASAAPSTRWIRRFSSDVACRNFRFTASTLSRRVSGFLFLVPGSALCCRLPLAFSSSVGTRGPSVIWISSSLSLALSSDDTVGDTESCPDGAGDTNGEASSWRNWEPSHHSSSSLRESKDARR
ncbi:uncharacterized protein LOC117188591 [Drosophila miranda]|uniref:uncharacterized protein LOC117188591 n=1 Tax=Drosophila miranda TaxID=7229 RepID=UPI00143F2CD0|nr:uncharacterized protein LOC117188591 [Drosophila miranda]